MDIKQRFGRALKKIRLSKNKTQEDFSNVSSRTYVSSLERGMKSVTLEKLEELAGVLDVHPLTLLHLTYQKNQEKKSSDELMELVRQEMCEIYEEN